MIQNARLRRLACSACKRPYSAQGLTVGQLHKGCVASPRGKLICEHINVHRPPNTGERNPAKCMDCSKVFD